MSKNLLTQMKFCLFVGILLLVPTFGQNMNQANDRGMISLKINQLRNDTGQLIAYLYYEGKGYPNKPELAYMQMKGSVKNRGGTVVFKDVPFGEYAIMVLHDENRSGELETNFFGMPKEGMGASNNAKGFMGPPNYEDAKFFIKSEKTNMIISVTYT